MCWSAAAEVLSGHCTHQCAEVPPGHCIYQCTEVPSGPCIHKCTEVSCTYINYLLRVPWSTIYISVPNFPRGIVYICVLEFTLRHCTRKCAEVPQGPCQCVKACPWSHGTRSNALTAAGRGYQYAPGYDSLRESLGREWSSCGSQRPMYSKFKFNYWFPVIWHTNNSISIVL